MSSVDEGNVVAAELRTNFGKGFARRLRAGGQVPAVLYGHGTEPVHLALPTHQLSLIVRRANALLELNYDGVTQLALIKDVQKDPVLQIIEHIDLLVVKAGEKLIVDVPVVIVGEPFSGAIANQDAATISLEVEATNIPDTIEVDVDGLQDGAHVTAADLKLPKGAALAVEGDLLIVGITVPAATETLAESADEAIAEEEAAE